MKIINWFRDHYVKYDNDGFAPGWNLFDDYLIDSEWNSNEIKLKRAQKRIYVKFLLSKLKLYDKIVVWFYINRIDKLSANKQKWFSNFLNERQIKGINYAERKLIESQKLYPNDPEKWYPYSPIRENWLEEIMIYGVIYKIPMKYF